MARKRKVQVTEKLTESNIQNVINMLESESPITKKLACEMLGIAYNTTRLSNIISEYKQNKERDAKKRAEKRGKPAQLEEVQYIISEYLSGATLDSINKALYRTNVFIKNVLDTYNVPIRKSSPNYFDPELIPEGAMQEQFKLGETVYSSRYDSIAVIRSEGQNTKKYGWVYKIYLLKDDLQHFAYQPASELASLQHLIKIGVMV